MASPGSGDYLFGMVSDTRNYLQIVDNYDTNGDGVLEETFKAAKYKTQQNDPLAYNASGMIAEKTYDDAGKTATFSGAGSHRSNAGVAPMTFTVVVTKHGVQPLAAVEITSADGVVLQSFTEQLRLFTASF